MTTRDRLEIAGILLFLIIGFALVVAVSVAGALGFWVLWTL